MTKQNHNDNDDQSKIIDFNNAITEMADLLMSLPQPQLNADARQRMLERVQQAIPVDSDSLTDEMVAMAELLMSLPQPQLNADARQRMLERVQQAIPVDSDSLSGDAVAMADLLMSLPQPQLNADARQHMLERVQQAVPTVATTEVPSRKLLHFPVVPALRLTASIAIFVMLMYQVGMPFITDSHSVEKLYPIQRSAELQDADLVSMIFS